MQTHVSEIAAIRERIAAEQTAAKLGLQGLSAGAARHDFITARQERVGVLHEELRGLVGDGAMALVAETLDWATALCRQFFCDHFDLLRLGRMANSAWKPLADLARRMAAEEQIHVDHVDAWIVRLGQGDGMGSDVGFGSFELFLTPGGHGRRLAQGQRDVVKGVLTLVVGRPPHTPPKSGQVRCPARRGRLLRG